MQPIQSDDTYDWQEPRADYHVRFYERSLTWPVSLSWLDSIVYAIEVMGPMYPHLRTVGTDSPPHFVYLFIFIKYSSHLLFIILKEYVRVKTQKDKVKYHYFSSMKGIYHGTTWTDCNFIWLYHPLMIHNLPYNIITSIKILIGTTQRAQKKKEVIIDVIIRSWNASILDNSLIKRQEKNDYNDATKKHFNYNCIP